MCCFGRIGVEELRCWFRQPHCGTCLSEPVTISYRLSPMWYCFSSLFCFYGPKLQTFSIGIFTSPESFSIFKHMNSRFLLRIGIFKLFISKFKREVVLWKNNNAYSCSVNCSENDACEITMWMLNRRQNCKKCYSSHYFVFMTQTSSSSTWFGDLGGNYCQGCRCTAILDKSSFVHCARHSNWEEFVSLPPGMGMYFLPIFVLRDLLNRKQ